MMTLSSTATPEMPTFIDAVFALLLIVVASILEYRYFWPRFRADIDAERPGARTRGYRRGFAAQWVFTLAALAIWATRHRSWSVLGLTLPGGWRLVLGIALVVLGVGFAALQLWSVARLPAARRVAARPKLGRVAFILPRTGEDHRWFVALSITAGFCEELLYRGYLPWIFAPWLGRAGAMAAVVLIFGISHIYQGWRGAIKATLAGAVLAAMVLSTGSLIPAMIVHALIDISGGTVGYWLFREYPTASGDGAAESSATPSDTIAAGADTGVAVRVS
jgi:membrane protease YdiL (CAAX protease family)